VHDWERFIAYHSADDDPDDQRIYEKFVPLLWRPPESAFPPDADRYIRRVDREFGPAYARFGLHRLLRDGIRDDYYRVVRRVAARIAATARKDQDRSPDQQGQDQARARPAAPSEPPVTRPASAPPAASRADPAPTPPRTGTAARGDRVPGGTASRHPTDRRSTSGRPVAARPVSKRIVVSYVGSDQDWADWLTFAARRAGHLVDQVRWHPTLGESLSAMARDISRRRPDLVVALLSRRYRTVDVPGPAALTAGEWEVLGDDGAVGGAVVRVVIDNEPLPAPLRAGMFFDVSELDDQAVERLFTAVGIASTSGAGTTDPPGRRPGTPPKIWNTPAENEFFAGRDTELERMHDLLSIRGKAVVVPRNGLSNLGVTEVAIEYAHRNKLGYGLVWWASCPQGAASQLEVLRAHIDADADEAAPASATGGRPGAGPPRLPRLVVFADADKPSELDGYLTDNGYLAGIDARVLVVANRVDADWADYTVEIGPLRRTESVLLLREAAPMVAPNLAAQIAAALDDRPGLLAGAGRLLLRGDVTPRACAELVNAARAAVGAPAPDAMPGAADPTPRPRGGASSRPAVGGPEPDPLAASSGAASGRRPADLGVVSDRDVINLLGELRKVDSVNDPDQFRSWVSVLEGILGRPVHLLDASLLAAKLLALLEDAVAQPGPAMLDAMARALETIDPTDLQVRRFRRLVDQVGTRWETADGAPPGGIRLSVDLPSEPAAPVGGQPRYLFFTSYARQRDNQLVLRLHKALQKELDLRIARGDPADGFIDLLSLQGGAHWRDELRHALIHAPVMLALWSDDYFRSDWCGREFAVFAERVRLATPPHGLPPAAILPLNWLPLTGKAPDCVAHLQVTNLNLGGGADKRPLMDLMRFNKRAFNKCVTALAERVQSVARDQLPPLDVSMADGLASAFGRPW
jgi:hypothetical protein